MLRYNILRAEIYRHRKNKIFIGVWLSLVECLVRDQEAGGSNPLTPTSKTKALAFVFCCKRIWTRAEVNDSLRRLSEPRWQSRRRAGENSNPLTPTSKTKAKKAESIDAICVFRLFLFLSVNEVLPQKVRLMLSNCCQKFCLLKIIWKIFIPPLDLELTLRCIMWSKMRWTGSIIRSHSTRQPLKQENLYGTDRKSVV